MSSPYFGGKAASLAANEKTVTPKGPLPKAPKRRVSRTTYSPTSGMGALEAATGGSYAFDKPATLRPEDITTLHRAAQHSPGVRAIGEIVSDPLGIIAATKAVNALRKHPGVGTGLGAGIAAAGLLPFGRLGKLAKIAAETKAATKLAPDEEKALQIVKEGVPLKERLATAKGKELAELHVAAKHVHDVNGVPRIVPSNHKLIEVYQHREASDVVKGGLKGAKSVRGKQDVLRSQEVKARVARANEHLNNQALEPEERLALAKNELRGELPKINFGGFKELDEAAVKALQKHILDHPHLLPFQKIRAAGALTKAVSGEVPQPSELTLLEHVFGKETTNGLAQISKHPYKDLILSTLNVPRSMMASFDLSAPFRQGLVIAARHPLIFAKNFKPMIRAFGSEKVYQGILEDIHARPTYPMMMAAKLAITELSKHVGPREEQFASELAEHIPGIGHGIRASGRAYTGYLDKLRADVFDHLLQRAESQGVNVQDEKFLKDLGRLVNDSTGRGSLGKLQGAGKVANAIFFSPRLLASRMNIIFAPLTYAKADPFVRREALKSMIGLAGTLSTILGVVSQIPGVKVVSDPRNPDWGKIKVGNTRVDIAGGFQQPLRLFAQLATQTAISSTTGKKLNLTATGFGQPNGLDLFLRFWEGKEAPVASIATDWLRQSDQVGNKFSWSREAVSHLTPLLAQDSYDLYKSQHGGMNGIEAAFGGYALGSVGFGIQTYGPKKPKTKKGSTSYFNGSSFPAEGGPSSPYFGG